MVEMKKEVEKSELSDASEDLNIEKPHHHDVKCGRGVTINKWPGNESFRSLVGLNKEVYVTSTKRQKMAISRSIVEAVRALKPPGRFLEKDPSTGLWNEIGHKKAIEKTSQALRDGAASLRKELTADFGDPDFVNSVFDEARDSSNDAIVADSPTRSLSETPADSHPLLERTLSQDAGEETKEPQGKKHQIQIENQGTPVSTIARNKKGKDVPKKAQRRSRSAQQTPAMSSKKFSRKSAPVSPRTPQPTHTMSQPNSPMPRHDGSPYHAVGRNSASLPVVLSNGFEHERQYIYRESSDSRYYGRSHSFDHYNSSPDARHEQYQQRQSWFYHDCYDSYATNRGDLTPASTYSSSSVPLPRQSWNSRTCYEEGLSERYGEASRIVPTLPYHRSPIPMGPLPPGRHQLSPAGYHMHHSEYPNAIAREWHSDYESEVYHSPQSHQHSSFNPKYTEAFPRWKAPYYRYHCDMAPSPGCETSGTDSLNQSGDSYLSVPSLAGESQGPSSPAFKYYGRLNLTPRSHSMDEDTPFRRHTNYPYEFSPPPASTQFRAVERRAAEHQYTDEFRSSHCKPTHTSISKIKDYKGFKKGALKPKHVYDGEILSTSVRRKESTERSNSAVSFRSSPLSNRMKSMIDDTDTPEPVEDIEMSPLSHEVEADDDDGPSMNALMELPENILSLPISPYGPHDDPLAPGAV